MHKRVKLIHLVQLNYYFLESNNTTTDDKSV